MTGRHSDLRDLKHVVILMQENRSFDHYFGSLRGVRGFDDRSTITLPGGDPVWRQPGAAGAQYPWRLGGQHFEGTDHSWGTQHQAWNGGRMNAWQQAKGGPVTLGYLNRQDLPFYYALADAYTIGDAYFCSALSATGPNRTYLWSGTINASTTHGDYVAYSGGETGDELGRFLGWPSYPETLEAAGVSWKIYQGSDNWGDNGAEYFATFAKYDRKQGGRPAPGVAWYDQGVAAVPEPSPADEGNADNLARAIRADVLAGTLPEVSWVVTNERFSEHPAAAPHDGEYYVSQVLAALHADPDVFNSTLVIIDYDENDGQFDHVPPPVPAPGTTDEFHLGLPVGLGYRVPLLLISPWTRGGWVTSEVSDHTSVIQFLERWTTALGRPADCPNISAWRRSVCGDLTSAFDFEHPVYGLPRLPDPGPPIGAPPVPYQGEPASNAMPEQEAGPKRARPLPYRPSANLDGFTGGGEARLSFSNAGPHVGRASHFAVYDNRTASAPGQYTVEAGAAVGATMAVGTGGYDLTVVGPNRFLRHFTGDSVGAGAQVTASYEGHGYGGGPVLVLRLVNDGTDELTFTVRPNHYARAVERSYRVPAHGHAAYQADPIVTSRGWYDLSVTVAGDPSWSRRYAGHLENGQPSVTG
jgi:phospholipase C